MAAEPRSGVLTKRSVELRELLATHRDEILGIAADCSVSRVLVVGSVARGTAHERSDVDLLVRVGDQATLMDLMYLRARLRDLLQVDVDIMDHDANGPGRADAEREGIPL